MIGRFEPLQGTVEREHGLLEAPRWRPDGSLIYSDVTAGGIFELRAGEAPRALLPGRRGVGGLLPHVDGGVVASGRSVFHFDGETQRELLAPDGVPGFNDLSTDGEGRIYAGALRFRPMAGERPVPGGIWRIEGGGRGEPIARGVEWPNGIGHSADGATLYVSDTSRRVVMAFPAEGGGPGEVFAEPGEGVPDGLAVDAEGGVWVALGAAGIARYRPDGRLDQMLEVPASFTSSLSFGGGDGRRLFVTTADLDGDQRGGVVLSSRSEIPGLPLALAAV